MSRERPWLALLCLVFGHDWVGNTAYKLTPDTGTSLYGDLCRTCGRFKPRENGKERFKNPMPTSFEEALRRRREDGDWNA